MRATDFSRRTFAAQQHLLAYSKECGTGAAPVQGSGNKLCLCVTASKVCQPDQTGLPHIPRAS
jgi:hypothetical protein